MSSLSFWHNSLLRQPLHKRQRPLQPPLQLFIALDAIGLHQHPALHRLAGNVERLDVLFRQRLFAFRRAIRESFQTPTSRLPRSRKPMPPNIFFSTMPFLPNSATRIRCARDSLKAMSGL